MGVEGGCEWGGEVCAYNVFDNFTHQIGSIHASFKTFTTVQHINANGFNVLTALIKPDNHAGYLSGI